MRLPCLRMYLLLVGVALQIAWVSAQPAARRGLELGPFAPGWRFDMLRDASRQYGATPTSIARPIPLTIWYPAKPATGSPTQFADLARLVEGQPSDESVDGTLRSRRDAAPVTRAFPLVLFAHTTPVGQAIMSEYLASHGFVVAGVISKGARTGPYRLSVDDVRGMVEDLAFAVQALRQYPFIDTERVSVIGMSNGAFGAVGLARRMPIRSIVSLDGTVGERAANKILPELGTAAAGLPSASLLHLFTPDNQYLDFTFLQSWPGVCGAVRIPTVAHGDFLSYGAFLESTPSSQPPRVNVAEKFAAINRLTLQFLQRSTPGSARVPELSSLERALGMSVSPCREAR